MAASARSGRFVGREREIARIAVALEAAADGRTRRVLVSGTGGAGVSRLIDESVRRIGRLAEPFTVLRWRAVAGRSREPYAPVIAGLRPYLAALDADERTRVVGPGIDALSPLLTETQVGDRDASPDRLRVGPDHRVAWLSEAVLGLLERASERRPVLLALEDLHLADAATRALVVFLARVHRPARLCIIGTYRTDRVAQDGSLVGDLAAITDAADPPDRLELGPLTRDELAQLVTEIEGERPTASLLLLAAERSGGNPLLAEEILAARRELSGVSLGSSLDELVAARLALRSAECRRVLRLLAHAAEPVRRDRLQGVADALDAEADAHLARSLGRSRRGMNGLDAEIADGVSEGLESGFIVEQADGALEVRHELIARSIVRELLPGQRRQVHLAFATTLTGRPAARAHHLLAAHETTAARDALFAAARGAAALGAAADQLSLLELAMELGDPDPGDREAAGLLLLETADAALAAGRSDRALTYLDAAATRFGERQDRPRLAGIHERLGRVARSRGWPILDWRG